MISLSQRNKLFHVCYLVPWQLILRISRNKKKHKVTPFWVPVARLHASAFFTRSRLNRSRLGFRTRVFTREVLPHTTRYFGGRHTAVLVDHEGARVEPSPNPADSVLVQSLVSRPSRVLECVQESNKEGEMLRERTAAERQIVQGLSWRDFTATMYRTLDILKVSTVGGWQKPTNCSPP